MTIHAEPAGRDNVRLTISDGVVEVTAVLEHEELKRFWHDLGAALEETDTA